MSKIPKKKSKLSASSIEEKKQVLDDISAEHAYEILMFEEALEPYIERDL